MVAAVLLFTLQNMGTVTVSFLSGSLTLRVALMAVLFYVLGMLTGGLLYGLLRSLVQRVRDSTPAAVAPRR